MISGRTRVESKSNRSCNHRLREQSATTRPISVCRATSFIFSTRPLIIGVPADAAVRNAISNFMCGWFRLRGAIKRLTGRTWKELGRNGAAMCEIKPARSIHSSSCPLIHLYDALIESIHLYVPLSHFCISILVQRGRRRPMLWQLTAGGDGKAQYYVLELMSVFE